MKITLSIANTILCVSMGLLLLYTMEFGVATRGHWLIDFEFFVYIGINILLIISIVAGWVVALKPPEKVSGKWKVLSFASLLVFAFLAIILLRG